MQFAQPTMKSGLLIAALIPLAVLATPGNATAQAPNPSSPGEEVRGENCMVQYFNKVDVAAKAEGTLMQLLFEEGDTVNEKDVMAIIDDTAAALTLELKLAEEKEAFLNAANEVNLEDAKNAEELASAESEAYKELRRQGAIPYWEMEKKRLEAKRAKLRIELADMQKKIAEVQMIAKRSERKIAEFELARRKVTAPSTGFIETRIAQLGQWVQPGTPIATLIQMDRLRVEGDFDASQYKHRIMKGAPARVTIYNEKGNEITVDGTIGYVSMEIDLNNRHRVWVEITNYKNDRDDWVIKPGMRAEISILGGQGQL
mgnify:CR=1 FL=1